VPFSAPAGRLCCRDTRRWSPGHRPDRRWRPGFNSPAGLVGLRSAGTVEWRRAYVGPWIVGCRRPVPGDCTAAVQPAVGGLSTRESSGVAPWWLSESVCLYRKPLADSSSWKRGSTCRSASRGGLEAAIPGGGPRAIAQASGGALCPAQRPGPDLLKGSLGGALRRRCVRRSSVRVSPAARACPAESSKATAVCKHPAAANRTCAFGHVP